MSFHIDSFVIDRTRGCLSLSLHQYSNIPFNFLPNVLPASPSNLCPPFKACIRLHEYFKSSFKPFRCSLFLYCSIQSIVFYLCSFWRGVGAGCNTKEVVDRLRYLEREIEDLELKEKELDQQKVWLQQSIRNVKTDSINRRYPLKHIRCVELTNFIIAAIFWRHKMCTKQWVKAMSNSSNGGWRFC